MSQAAIIATQSAVRDEAALAKWPVQQQSWLRQWDPPLRYAWTTEPALMDPQQAKRAITCNKNTDSLCPPPEIPTSRRRPTKRAYATFCRNISGLPPRCNSRQYVRSFF